MNINWKFWFFMMTAAISLFAASCSQEVSKNGGEPKVMLVQATFQVEGMTIRNGIL